MSPKDQQNAGRDGSLPIRGVREGDEIPALVLADARRQEFELPRVELRLDPARLGLSRRYGPSWVERVLALRQHYGSFQLAWLEALMRAADVRASQIALPLDSRLPLDLVEVQAKPDSLDCDADLRRWIESTIAAARPQPEAVTARRQGARDLAAGAAQTPTKRTRRGAS